MADLASRTVFKRHLAGLNSGAYRIRKWRKEVASAAHQGVQHAHHLGGRGAQLCEVVFGGLPAGGRPHAPRLSTCRTSSCEGHALRDGTRRSWAIPGRLRSTHSCWRQKPCIHIGHCTCTDAACPTNAKREEVCATARSPKFLFGALGVTVGIEYRIPQL